MVKVEVHSDGTAAVDIVRDGAKGVKEGVADGVRRAAGELAVDVAAHTPSRSGTARLAVQVLAHQFIENGQIVKYDYREAFYMRFVIRGAKPHRIYNKYLSARGFRQALRRAERLGEEFAGPKRSLFFRLQGSPRFFGEVDHPGVIGRDILGQRLAANTSRMLDTIYESIHRSMSKRRH